MIVTGLHVTGTIYEREIFSKPRQVRAVDYAGYGQSNFWLQLPICLMYIHLNLMNIWKFHSFPHAYSFNNNSFILFWKDLVDILKISLLYNLLIVGKKNPLQYCIWTFLRYFYNTLCLQLFTFDTKEQQFHLFKTFTSVFKTHRVHFVIMFLTISKPMKHVYMLC